jgi:signal transduction histidine kinase
MSHELRTPLNAIGGYTELLEVGVAGEVSAQQREYLVRIRAAQQHLLSLINDLLNYSRIEAGQITYDVGQVPIKPLLDRVCQLVDVHANGKGLTLTIADCPEDIVALADRVKVEQIVLNLVSNAIKFTPRRGSITLSCGRKGQNVFVEVIDTGPGIPADKHEAVFEPFVQLGRSLTHVQEGAGLGLAISRDLARAMHGDLTLDSVPGQGARFTLTLRRG